MLNVSEPEFISPVNSPAISRAHLAKEPHLHQLHHHHHHHSPQQQQQQQQQHSPQVAPPHPHQHTGQVKIITSPKVTIVSLALHLTTPISTNVAFNSWIFQSVRYIWTFQSVRYIMNIILTYKSVRHISVIKVWSCQRLYITQSKKLYIWKMEMLYCMKWHTSSY